MDKDVRLISAMYNEGIQAHEIQYTTPQGGSGYASSTGVIKDTDHFTRYINQWDFGDLEWTKEKGGLTFVKPAKQKIASGALYCQNGELKYQANGGVPVTISGATTGYTPVGEYVDTFSAGTQYTEDDPMPVIASKRQSISQTFRSNRAPIGQEILFKTSEIWSDAGTRWASGVKIVNGHEFKIGKEMLDERGWTLIPSGQIQE